MKTVRAEGCAKPLSKNERLFANLRRFYSPFDKLRACSVLDTGANVARADEMIVNSLLGHIGRTIGLAATAQKTNYQSSLRALYGVARNLRTSALPRTSRYESAGCFQTLRTGSRLGRA